MCVVLNAVWLSRAQGHREEPNFQPLSPGNEIPLHGRHLSARGRGGGLSYPGHGGGLLGLSPAVRRCRVRPGRFFSSCLLFLSVRTPD